MLRLYYTGANSYLDIQKNKELSLGGLISNTIIPNSYLNSLFSNITQYSKQLNVDQIIGIAVKNEDQDLESVEFYFDINEDSICNYEISVVSMSQDSDGQFYMESISNQNSLPYYADFYEANGVDNKVNLGQMLSGEYLGLWIKRKIKTTIVLTDDELYQMFLNEEVLNTSEQVKLVFIETILEDSSSS